MINKQHLALFFEHSRPPKYTKKYIIASVNWRYQSFVLSGMKLSKTKTSAVVTCTHRLYIISHVMIFANAIEKSKIFNNRKVPKESVLTNEINN